VSHVDALLCMNAFLKRLKDNKRHNRKKRDPEFFIKTEIASVQSLCSNRLCRGKSELHRAGCRSRAARLKLGDDGASRSLQRVQQKTDRFEYQQGKQSKGETAV